MCLNNDITRRNFNFGEQLIGRSAFNKADPLLATTERATEPAERRLSRWTGLTSAPPPAPSAPLQPDIQLTPIRKTYGGTLLTGGG